MRRRSVCGGRECVGLCNHFDPDTVSQLCFSTRQGELPRPMDPEPTASLRSHAPLYARQTFRATGQTCAWRFPAAFANHATREERGDALRADACRSTKSLTWRTPWKLPECLWHLPTRKSASLQAGTATCCAVLQGKRDRRTWPLQRRPAR